MSHDNLINNINLSKNIKDEVLDMSSSLKIFLKKFLGRENVEEIINNNFSDKELQLISDKFFSNYECKDNILSKDVLIDLEIFEGLGIKKEDNIYRFIDKCQTYMGKYLLKKILSNPIKDTSKLLYRQDFIKKIYNDEELYKQILLKLDNIKSKESQLLWLWKALNEETQYLFNMVYFQNRFLKFLNRNELVMKLYNYYVIIFSPIYGIISPIMMVLAPFILLKFYFKTDINLTSYLKIIKITFSGFGNILGADLTKQDNPTFSMTNIISILIWVIFYIHALFNNINNAINTNKIINIMHKKLNDISSILDNGKDIYELLGNDLNDNSFYMNCKFKEHFTVLKSNTFKEEPNFYSNKGLILKTYNILLEKKDNLIDNIRYISNIDCFNSIVTLIKSSENVNYCFSEFNQNSKRPSIETESLAYPILIDNIVTNNITLGTSFPQNACITGPNAGGKSTFIKSICLGILFSQTLTVAPAKFFKLTPFSRIDTYLNIPDCKGKESLFEAEMSRSLNYINSIKKLQKEDFSFVIMDEIFSSTNPEEGIAGAYAIAKNISSYNNNISIITSHYTYLSKLEQTGKFKNYHIPIERDIDNKIVYKYKLQSGVSNQFIALELLESKGFDRDIVLEAKNVCNHLCAENMKKKPPSFTQIKKYRRISRDRKNLKKDTGKKFQIEENIPEEVENFIDTGELNEKDNEVVINNDDNVDVNKKIAEEKVEDTIQNIDTPNKENDIEENNDKIDVNDVEEKVDEPIKRVDIVEPFKENVNLNENKKEEPKPKKKRGRKKKIDTK